MTLLMASAVHRFPPTPTRSSQIHARYNFGLRKAGSLKPRELFQSGMNPQTLNEPKLTCLDDRNEGSNRHQIRNANDGGCADKRDGASQEIASNNHRKPPLLPNGHIPFREPPCRGQQVGRSRSSIRDASLISEGDAAYSSSADRLNPSSPGSLLPTTLEERHD
jgi:hypothetical protein